MNGEPLSHGHSAPLILTGREAAAKVTDLRLLLSTPGCMKIIETHVAEAIFPVYKPRTSLHCRVRGGDRRVAPQAILDEGGVMNHSADGAQPSPAQEPSAGELVKQLSEQVSVLVRVS